MIPLMTLAVALGLAFAPTQGDGAEPLRTIIYDVRSIAPDLSSEQRWVPLLPFLFAGQDWDVDEDELRDHVVLLLWRLWGEEFEYEGRQLEELGGGRVLVTAPAEVHARIDELFGLLRASFGRRAIVDWTVFSIPDVNRLPPSVDVAQVAGLVKAGVLVPLQQRREQLVVGQSVIRELHDVRRVVRRWDGEIAQTSGVAVPVLESLPTGLTLALRAESAGAPDALRLRFLQGLSRLRELESRPTGQLTRVTLDNSVHELTREALIDFTTVDWSLLAGSGVLRPGESLLDIGAVQTHAGSVALALLVELAEVDPAPGPLRLGDESVAVIDGSSLYWQSFEPPRLGVNQLRGAGDEGEMDGYTRADIDPVAFPSPEIQDDFADWRIGERFERDDVDVHWSSLGHWTFLASAPDVVEAVLADFDELLAARRQLVLELGLSRVGSEPSAVARVLLPLESGSAGMALVGDALNLVDGFDVDVATAAMISVPRLVDVFDGLVVSATADLTGAVRVDVLDHRLVELGHLGARNAGADVLDRSRFTTAQVRARVPADGQRHVLALVGGAVDGADALQLWAQVRPRGADVR